MQNETEIRQTLDDIALPSLKRTLGSLNIIRSVKCIGNRIELELGTPIMNDRAQESLKARIVQTLKKTLGVDNVKLTYVTVKPDQLNEIKHVIAVMSGKGGVGKSLVSGLLATGLKRKGFSVGLLDADITGPSIPRMFGIMEKPLSDKEGLLPVLSDSGISIMSINLILEEEEEAIIWRGPMIANAITQFWKEVYWGKLDYLIVDLPPGTSDVPLTVMQSVPIAGVVMVFTPQELTTMIVNKAVRMVHKMDKRIIGLVENMSYLYIEDLSQKIELFGPSRAEKISATAGAPLLARLPIDPQLAKRCDEGHIEDYRSNDVTQMIDAISKIVAIQ